MSYGDPDTYRRIRRVERCQARLLAEPPTSGRTTAVRVSILEERTRQPVFETPQGTIK